MNLEELLKDPSECVHAFHRWPDEIYEVHSERIMKGIAGSPKHLKSIVWLYANERMQQSRQHWWPEVLKSPNISAHLLEILVARDVPYSKHHKQLAQAITKDPTWSAKAGCQSRVPEKILDILLKSAVKHPKSALRVLADWPDDYILKHRSEIFKPITKSPEATYKAFTELGLGLLKEYPEIIERMKTLPFRCRVALEKSVKEVPDESTSLNLHDNVEYYLEELQKTVTSDPVQCAWLYINKSYQGLDNDFIANIFYIISRDPKASAMCIFGTNNDLLKEFAKGAMRNLYYLINKSRWPIIPGHMYPVHEAGIVADDSRIRNLARRMNADEFRKWIYGANQVTQRNDLKKNIDRLLDASFEVHEGIMNLGGVLDPPVDSMDTYILNILVEEEGFESLAKFSDLDKDRQKAFRDITARHGRSLYNINPSTMYAILDAYNSLDDKEGPEFIEAYNLCANQGTLDEWAGSLQEQMHEDVIGGGRYRQLAHRVAQ